MIHKKSHKTTEMRRDDKLNEEDSEEQTIEFIEDAMEWSANVILSSLVYAVLEIINVFYS